MNKFIEVRYGVFVAAEHIVAVWRNSESGVLRISTNEGVTEGNGCVYDVAEIFEWTVLFSLGLCESHKKSDT